jgi:site-specific DNA-methyltransferase (adenine-specific)
MHHELHHGDCLEVLKTIPASSVDCVITDPPYGIGFPYLSYDDTRENLARLIAGFMPEVCRIAKSVFVLCGPTQIAMYPQADWVCNVSWNTTGSFGKFGYNQWTPVLCYGNDVKGFGSVNGVLKSDTLRISGGGGVGFLRSADEKKHTCPKPLTVMNIVVQRLTQVGDTILDPFTGSGSTGVAAVAMGRNFIGIEKDAAYFEIAKKRIAEVSQPLFV